LKEKAAGYIPKKWRFLINAPFFVSDYCCYHLKEGVFRSYLKKTGVAPMLGMRISESNKRAMLYKKRGCNAFDLKSPVSWPIAFWSDKDINQYINSYNLDYSRAYDSGENRTGCMFCMYGIQYDSTPNRFQRMKIYHPKEYNFSMGPLGCFDVLKFLNIKAA
jgi:3'-phosphoadenosine 5'-phosphosulfate sulfotransferase (PAPS reductase)/FAD synthetase